MNLCNAKVEVMTSQESDLLFIVCRGEVGRFVLALDPEAARELAVALVEYANEYDVEGVQ